MKTAHIWSEVSLPQKTCSQSFHKEKESEAGESQNLEGITSPKHNAIKDKDRLKNLFWLTDMKKPWLLQKLFDSMEGKNKTKANGEV